MLIKKKKLKNINENLNLVILFIIRLFFIFKKLYFANLFRNILKVSLSTINFLVTNKNQEHRTMVATYRFNVNISTMV